MDDFSHLDYYELLGAPRDASLEDIKRAYYKQMVRYHPDRFANASPEEKEYASKRAQRLNEAYQVLSDSNSRNAYNLKQASARGNASVRRTVHQRPAPLKRDQASPADYLVALYNQARTHLDAGRYAQAIGVLQRLQQIDPFYRDSAALLSRAEALQRDHEQATKAPPPPTRPVAVSNKNRQRIIFGGIGGIALAALVAAGFWLRQGQQPTVSNASANASTAEVSDTSANEASIPPLSAPSVTPESSATAAPSATIAPSATPSPIPVSTPMMAPAEEGELLLVDGFSNQSNWASVQESAWSVGYNDNAYEITVLPGIGNIWSYKTGPEEDKVGIGVNVAVAGGDAGLLLRYIDAGNYSAFFVNPGKARYRLEQHRNGSVEIIAEGGADEIKVGKGKSNRLVAHLDDNTVRLYINDALVETSLLKDAAKSPLYGMIAAAGTDVAVARFTKLEIRALP